jgi:sugar/nucleoside kinase (ribokinase family)
MAPSADRPRRPRAVIAGLCTFDLIQQVERVPAANEKATARRQVVAAGGPAANAAATFAHLGGDATLITAVGDHPLAAGVKADLADLGVTLVDLAAGDPRPPAVSSVLVTAGTGARSVVSRNAAGRDVRAPDDLDALIGDADLVLVDGHHPALARAALSAARDRLTLLDGGSWKDHLPELLPLVDIAICSADLRPPSGGPTLPFLREQGVRWAAVTDGPNPVRWAGPASSGEIEVPAVDAVDTTGAGDVFHGAFAYAVAAAGALDAAPLTAAGLTGTVLTEAVLTEAASTGTGSIGTLSAEPASTGATLTEALFTDALRRAGEVAARSCRSFGTREWMRPAA